MTSEAQMTHERVDDIPVLLHIMHERLGFDQSLDKLVPRHGNWLGLSMGLVMVSWLTHILSECSHFMSPVREWANARPETLSRLLGQPLRETDLSDDRLSEVVRTLSDNPLWHSLEASVNQQMIRVYRLPVKRIRLDTTTVSVDSAQAASVLFQRGYSKDHRPDLPQLKVMLAALDPLGALLGADVVPGNVADDGLYVPMIDRLLEQLDTRGLLFIGDSKMSALATRAHIAARGHAYLLPLAQVGQVPEQLAAWIAKANSGDVALTHLRAEDDSPWGEGYEFRRAQSHQPADGPLRQWQERVLVVRSTRFAAAAQRGLAQRLQRAESAIRDLTPPRARGQRQFTEEAPLRAAVQAILAKHAVSDWLSVSFKLEQKQQSVRAYGDRPARVARTQRYVVSVRRKPAAIEAYAQTLGWRAYVTNMSRKQLSLAEAVQVYCDEWLIERDCQRLKGRPLSLSPLWLTRPDHAIGLTRLLTLAARVLALVEHDVRCQLHDSRRSLTGLYTGQATRATDRPTTERLLKAFDKIALVVIRTSSSVQRYLTALSSLQQDILHLMHCPATLYSQLAPDST